MKKITVLILACLMILSFSSVITASDKVLKGSDATEKSPKGVNNAGDVIRGWDEDGYIGFSDIDLTGVKSIRISAKSNYMRGDNAEAFGIYIDDPIKGECLGYILVNEERQDFTYYGVNIPETKGVHKLYLKQNYSHSNYLYVSEIVLSEEAWVDPMAVTPIPDSKIIDTYSDTWVAVDNVGRRLADFEEVGEVKEGKHDVLIFYHNWHIHETEAVNAMDVINAHPEAKDDYYHSAWPSAGPIYWGEPIYGYYTGMDYWHYRKAAELMASAGVDAVYIDYTNSDAIYVKALDVMMKAYHDAREDGVDVPKIGGYLQMGGTPENKLRSLKALYFNLYKNEYYKDLWYYLDGKPLVVQSSWKDVLNAVNKEDTEEVRLVNEMLDFFTFRGAMSNETNDFMTKDNTAWHWLVPYPQPAYGLTDSGRVEMVNLGMAINRSYIGEVSSYWIFSGKYVKTKNYTEAFGDDYRPEAVHEGNFFREQASRVLALDPEHVFVDGWNEWNSQRSAELYGYKNVFIDLYDNAGSRDFEPHKGELKDDYYMLLCDFIRKYKGVRPAPVASEAKTIDISGDLSQWDSVEPKFVNYYGDYERDEVGYKKYKSEEFHHYTTEVVNSIDSAKVSRDNEHFYFLINAENDIVEGENFMHIYINSDRNKATGWEGYDYAVNVAGKGIVSKFETNEFKLTDIGNAEMNISSKSLMIKLSKALVGETEKADFEFKITDNIEANGDLMLFYTEGNSAPVGRFNYLYTEIPQTALTKDERKALSDTTILKAGSAKMIANGGKMYVCDKDIRVTAFAENNTLYVPTTALEDIMGYGETKVTYDNVKNILIIKTHELTEREITDYQWAYTTLGTLDARVDGVATAISAPVKAVNGIIYVPVSLLSECFGWEVISVDNGAYAISQRTAEVTTAKALLHHFN